MHYKNGREALNNDPVIGKINGKVRAGVLHSINADCTSCNGKFAETIPGGHEQHYVTVGDLFHAEDALNAATERFAKPVTTQAPVA